MPKFSIICLAGGIAVIGCAHRTQPVLKAPVVVGIGAPTQSKTIGSFPPARLRVSAHLPFHFSGPTGRSEWGAHEEDPWNWWILDAKTIGYWNKLNNAHLKVDASFVFDHAKGAWPGSGFNFLPIFPAWAPDEKPNQGNSLSLFAGAARFLPNGKVFAWAHAPIASWVLVDPEIGSYTKLTTSLAPPCHAADEAPCTESLAPNLPLTKTIHAKAIQIARISRDGSTVDELTLEGTEQTFESTNADQRDDKVALAREEIRTASGGIMLAGACDNRNMQGYCVRQPSGRWKTVTLPLEQIVAEHANICPKADRTRVLPLSDGTALVVAGATSGDEKCATWWTAPAGTVRMKGSIDDFSERLVNDDGDGHFFFWPVVRGSQQCRIDPHLDGSQTEECVEGAIDRVGRLGILRRPNGSLAETTDAGLNWSAIDLLPGTPTNDIACFAIGCRIGPFWRIGWGR